MELSSLFNSPPILTSKNFIYVQTRCKCQNLSIPNELMAAIYTSRAKLSTLLISGSLPGGQLMTTSEVENYPGFPNGIFGPELMMNMRQQAERFGANFLDDEVTKVDFRTSPLKIETHTQLFRGEAILVCTGASPRKLGITAEQQFAGRGVSYCATCDGPENNHYERARYFRRRHSRIRKSIFFGIM